ncbi:ABC transporter ATP-binding protein [Anoxybacillus ayderensis]|uniref:ABC transporter ATP-binding protein n=1 Tax=Anoxybacillus ayderensis TaxID=265546 RepID=UPI002E1EC934|nr:ABC transporter ATP-binding protein [Anoxybacillus ayderensis]
MITLKHVTKRFYEKKVLDNVTFRFENGRTYVISGQSGCGKTTLLNILAGYINVDEGKVEKKESIKIEYLFQDDMLFSNLTVKEQMYIKYVAVCKHNRYFEQKSVEALALFRIENLIDRKIAVLSGGERRRVQLALLFMNDPDVVLFDEPLSRLDQQNQYLIAEMISTIFTNKLCIIVTHECVELFSNAIRLAMAGGKLRNG